MRVSANEVYAVKHAVFIILKTNNSDNLSAAKNFMISYPSEDMQKNSYKLNLREAGITQPMFVIKNMDDTPVEIAWRVSEMSSQGHVIYEAATVYDACFACEHGLYGSDNVVYAVDPNIEHSDLLDILRECEAA